jgi:hypothetical protein
MKIDTIQPLLNLQSFYDFAKLNKTDQSLVLTEQGIFLDIDSESTTFTRLYFLKGFFVEEIVSRNQNRVIDIIPYKQGYKIERYLEVKRFAPTTRRSVSIDRSVN